MKGQVSGQKLAFALSVANQERTKMVAFTNFYDSGNAKLLSKIEAAIKANLARISGMKDNISNIEGENEELAKQND